MSLFEEVMSLAVQMPIAERERLGRALGLSVHTKGPGKVLPLNQFVSRPDPAQSAAWRKAETGHAVVDTRRTAGGATQNAEATSGPQALFGIWNDGETPVETTSDDATSQSANGATASQLPRNSPVILHTDVCVELAMGKDAALQFFQAPPVEIRLATATYLALLGAAQNEEQLARITRFVQPYAVLSLGPMASSRSVELMLQHALRDGLNPLDALISATALAHEIPLVATDVRPFQNVAELSVARPY